MIPSKEDITFFRNKIIRWLRQNERKYPWRDTRDPYKILIAEMMLQRTKSDQVKPVYESFVIHYPDIDSLASAKHKNIEEILYPLGLIFRTSHFILLANEIKEKYNSMIPSTRDKLIRLPGVGQYIAGAVLSICFGKKEWIVDSNVVRIFKRYFGLITTKEGRRDKHVIQLAKNYVTCRNPRKANLAILDFSSLVCIPRNPLCNNCSLKNKCNYFIH